MKVDALVREGLLELVGSDASAAERLIRDARRHLGSARKLAVSDRNGAYQLAYDAARKAVTAHMTARGYRVRTHGRGAHAAVARYAVSALSAPEARHLDRMRRNRNRAEYGAVVVGAAQLSADLEHAAAIVSNVEKELLP